MNTKFDFFNPNEKFEIEQPMYKRKFNEGTLHWKLKNLSARWLIDEGQRLYGEEITVGKFRFDLSGESTTGNKFALEVGDINCSHSNLQERLFNYQKKIMALFWIPFSHSHLMEYSNSLLSVPFMDSRFKQFWGTKHNFNTGHKILFFNLDMMVAINDYKIEKKMFSTAFMPKENKITEEENKQSAQ